jgi:O-antigen/teichoic acid export membrane protein
VTAIANLASGAARGAAWNFATVLAERGFGFVVLGVLLRHVPVAEVGVVAIGSAMADLVRMLVAGGAGEQVQAAPGDAAVAAGAFWSQFLASVLLILLLLGAAPWIARLYHDPALALVLRALALSVFLAAFAVVPAAQLAAQFRFRALGLMAFGSTAAGGLLALPLALAGHGVAALIGQRLAGVAFYAACACLVTGWRPPRPPAWPSLRRSVRFSWPLMQAAVVDYVSLTAYVVVVGLAMPLADVGVFRIAQRLVEVLQEVAFAPARKVFLPVFVAVRGQPARQFAAVSDMLDVLAVAMFFAAAVCGAAARPIVLLMFGAHWAAAAPVFAVLTLMAPVAALYGVINPLLTAAGKTGLVGYLALGNVAMILAAAGLAAPYGLNALAWALAGRGLLTMALFIPAMRAGLGRRVRPLLRLLVLPALALVAARLAGWAALAALPAAGLLVQLLVAVAASGGVFSATMLLLAPARIGRMAARLGRAMRGEVVHGQPGG